MKQNILNIKLFFIVFMLIFAHSANAQTPKYIQLTDASGFDTAVFQNELEAAAQKLLSAFPTTVRDSFKVFSGAFYINHRNNTTGIEERFDYMKKQARLQSKYYLLIMKESEPLFAHKKFWIALRLPNYGSFKCINAGQITALAYKLEQYAAIVRKAQNYNPVFYADCEIKVMDSLQRRITKIVDCCYSRSADCVNEEPEGIVIDQEGQLIGTTGVKDGKVYLLKVNRYLDKDLALSLFDNPETTYKSFENMSTKKKEFEKYKITRVFIHANSGNPTFLTTLPYSNNLFEIPYSEKMKQDIWAIIAKDNSERGSSTNKYEYGGRVEQTDFDSDLNKGIIGVKETKNSNIGQPVNPCDNKEKATISCISYPNSTLVNFHSHPSIDLRKITLNSFGNGPIIAEDKECFFYQSPSKADMGNCIKNYPGGVHEELKGYVFARRNHYIYFYDKDGVEAVLEDSFYLYNGSDLSKFKNYIELK